jgi:hypothetical protein
MSDTPDVTTFFVRTPNPRPDFRSVAVFLWGEHHDYDSDGDCSYPADRNWTELTLDSRELEDERVDVVPARKEPLTLKVESNRGSLAARVAHYLAVVTGGTISEEVEGKYVVAAVFRDRLGDFDVAGAMRRATEYVSRRT